MLSWLLDCFLSTWLRSAHKTENENTIRVRSCLCARWKAWAWTFDWWICSSKHHWLTHLLIIPSTVGELAAMPVSTGLQCWLNMFTIQREIDKLWLCRCVCVCVGLYRMCFWVGSERKRDCKVMVLWPLLQFWSLWYRRPNCPLRVPENQKHGYMLGLFWKSPGRLANHNHSLWIKWLLSSLALDIELIVEFLHERHFISIILQT